MIRRDFFKTLAATKLALLAETSDSSRAETASLTSPATASGSLNAAALQDGPSSPDFAPVALKGPTASRTSQLLSCRNPSPKRFRRPHEVPVSAGASRSTSIAPCWKNPSPEKEIAALRFEPKTGVTVISGISTGKATAEQFRWKRRRKAILRVPEGTVFDYRVDRLGVLNQIQLDMGQVISTEARLRCPNDDWAATYNNKVADVSPQEILIEYTAHPDARFHLWDGSIVAVSELKGTGTAGPLTRVTPATRRVQIRVVEKASGRPVAVKLHVHGESPCTEGFTTNCMHGATSRTQRRDRTSITMTGLTHDQSLPSLSHPRKSPSSFRKIAHAGSSSIMRWFALGSET
jgi:hypothetical protein